LSYSGHSTCLGQNIQKRLFLKRQNPLAPLPGAILIDFIISAGFDVAIAVPPDFGAYIGAGFFGALVMTNDDVEYVAREMVGRFGAEAVDVARELAKGAEERQRASAQTWRDIAGAVERLWPNP
jgi:hypothetical protein